eukprot:12399938-Karenia_brevis.AAC.1
MLEGPVGMMSLGDMLLAAGYHVDRGKWVPPPPAGPIPDGYVEPPPPPPPSPQRWVEAHHIPQGGV